MQTAAGKLFVVMDVGVAESGGGLHDSVDRSSAQYANQLSVFSI